MPCPNTFINANCNVQPDCVFLAEADHRLLNNLQTVASLLSLQSRRCSSQEAAAQLASAATRVTSLQRVHRQLHSLERKGTIAFRSFLDKLCEELAVALLPSKGAISMIRVRAVEVNLPVRTAASLAFIVNELVTNASKYGSGAILIDLTVSPTGECALSVSNDGPPLPAKFDTAQSSGLGMTIVHAFARQIGANLTIERGGAGAGPTFKFSFSLVEHISTETVAL